MRESGGETLDFVRMFHAKTALICPPFLTGNVPQSRTHEHQRQFTVGKCVDNARLTADLAA